MELSIDNLDQLYEILKIADQNSKAIINIFNFDDQIISSPGNIQLLDLLLEKISNNTFEILHIKAFLRNCEYLPKSIKMTAQQKATLSLCQELYFQIEDITHKVAQWGIKLKEKLNKEKLPIPDDLKNFKSSVQVIDSNISREELLQMYEQTRDVLREIYNNLLFVDHHNMIETACYALEVKQGNTIFIETEHEMNIVMDYGLFEYRKEGKNIVERYFNENHNLYGPQKLAILKALKDSKFSLLEIIEPACDCGIIARDHLRDQSLFLIDRTLYEFLIKTNNKFYLLTHYINMPLFSITTGAATPILMNSDIGKIIWHIFENLIKLSKKEISHNKIKRQHKYITDLYKIIIHENVAKEVYSKKLPTIF